MFVPPLRRSWRYGRGMVFPLRTVIAALACATFAPAAIAHPHVWVTMHSELVYAPDGSLTGIRHHWTFDDMFSAFALQGTTGKTKGKFTREELAPLAKVNIESLKEYKYFTYATADGKKAEFVEPHSNYWLDYKNSVLTLNFTLPLKKPVKAKHLQIEIYDPTIFVDFEFAKGTPAHLVGAPAACKLDVELPHDITTAQSQKLGEAFFNALSSSQNWGAQFANKIVVNCP
jgi:ABC-type uncharacterized transport system substrate-binding protein